MPRASRDGGGAAHAVGLLGDEDAAAFGLRRDRLAEAVEVAGKKYVPLGGIIAERKQRQAAERQMQEAVARVPFPPEWPIAIVCQRGAAAIAPAENSPRQRSSQCRNIRSASWRLPRQCVLALLLSSRRHADRKSVV